MANNIVIYQKDLNLSSSKFTKSPDDRKVKKINVFVLLTQVLCMKLAVSCVHDEAHQKGKKRRSNCKDTNLSLRAHSPVLVSRKNKIFLRHNCLITPEAGVLVRENNSRIEQAFPSAGATFP